MDFGIPEISRFSKITGSVFISHYNYFMVTNTYKNRVFGHGVMLAHRDILKPNVHLKLATNF